MQRQYLADEIAHYLKSNKRMLQEAVTPIDWCWLLLSPFNFVNRAGFFYCCRWLLNSISTHLSYLPASIVPPGKSQSCLLHVLLSWALLLFSLPRGPIFVPAVRSDLRYSWQPVLRFWCATRQKTVSVYQSILTLLYHSEGRKFREVSPLRGWLATTETGSTNLYGVYKCWF